MIVFSIRKFFLRKFSVRKFIMNARWLSVWRNAQPKLCVENRDTEHKERERQRDRCETLRRKQTRGWIVCVMLSSSWVSSLHVFKAHRNKEEARGREGGYK